MANLQKVTPFLRYDGAAEEAANLYVSLFRNSRILSVTPLEAGPAKGVALVEFELEGQRFTALDGGPMFPFSPAVSFGISCDTQEEIDHFWAGLSEDGEEEQCGWLRDRYGLSWQVTPAALAEWMEGSGAESPHGSPPPDGEDRH